LRYEERHFLNVLLHFAISGVVSFIWLQFEDCLVFFSCSRLGKLVQTNAAKTPGTKVSGEWFVLFQPTDLKVLRAKTAQVDVRQSF